MPFVHIFISMPLFIRVIRFFIVSVYHILMPLL